MTTPTLPDKMPKGLMAAAGMAAAGRAGHGTQAGGTRAAGDQAACLRCLASFLRTISRLSGER